MPVSRVSEDTMSSSGFVARSRSDSPRYAPSWGIDVLDPAPPSDNGPSVGLAALALVACDLSPDTLSFASFSESDAGGRSGTALGTPRHPGASSSKITSLEKLCFPIKLLTNQPTRPFSYPTNMALYLLGPAFVRSSGAIAG